MLKLIQIDISHAVQEGLEYVNKKQNLQTYDQFLKTKYSFSNKGVVYFIFVNQELKYIGKSKGKRFKQRMRNHFIKKSKKTASKLKEITKEIANGNMVEFSFLLTEKESFRSVIEDEIILNFKEKCTLWNRQKG